MAACTAAWAQEGKGRIVIALGICTDSVGDQPVIRLRRVDKSERHNVVGPFLPLWDYTDETGRFKVFTPSLAAGEWEMFKHSMMTKPQLGTTVTHTSRVDYSHKFTVAPGKVVDLGRYCVATQSTGEIFEDGKVYNQVPRIVYLHASANREADLESALKGDGTPLELVRARPDPPERLGASLRSRFIEPRVIGKPAAPKPMEIPR